MTVDTNVITDAVTGTPRVVPEIGDNSPSIAQQIVLTTNSLCKGIIGIPTGPVSPDSSIYGTFTDIRPPASAISVVTLCQLPAGNYTIDCEIAGRFAGAVGAASGPDIRIDLVNVALTTVVGIVHLYHAAGTAEAKRRFNIITAEPCLLRRISNATGAGQTIEVVFAFAVERHL